MGFVLPDLKKQTMIVMPATVLEISKHFKLLFPGFEGNVGGDFCSHMFKTLHFS